MRIPATRLTPLLYVASGLALSACSSSDGAGPLSPDWPRAGSLLGDPAAGRLAFVEGCASCHASRDGFDLAAFDFTRTSGSRTAGCRSSALDMTPGVVEFVFQHWIERLESGPPGFGPGLMRAYLLDQRNYAAASSDGKRWPRILTLRDRLPELLV